MSEIGVAAAQFGPVADEAVNLERIRELATQAAGRGARVVVLPEYSSYFVDPFDDTLAAHAQSVDGPFVAGLRDLAASLDQVLVAGLLEQGSGERVRNTVVAVGADGPLATYRKAHLYDAFGQRESDRVEPGELTAPETFDLDGLRFGLVTCYDLRFPESTRVLADAGVTAVLVPAQWVRGPLKEDHWATLIAARAIENTCYVAAADHPPKYGIGLSRVVDPQGVTLAGVGAGDGLAVGFLVADEVRRVRERNPALELRRYRVVPRG